MDPGLTAQHVIIRGRVQGVGYRNWTAREAAKRGLAGWVRNRTDGTVEAVFSGPQAQVDDMIAACRRGPMPAKVEEIVQRDSAEMPEIKEFQVRPTE